MTLSLKIAWMISLPNSSKKRRNAKPQTRKMLRAGCLQIKSIALVLWIFQSFISTSIGLLIMNLYVQSQMIFKASLQRKNPTAQIRFSLKTRLKLTQTWSSIRRTTRFLWAQSLEWVTIYNKRTSSPRRPWVKMSFRLIRRWQRASKRNLNMNHLKSRKSLAHVKK